MLAVLQDFYGSMAQISFTLLGLWWVVVQFKYADFMKDRRRRLQTYDTSLYFVLPGIMSLISLLTTTGLLWRITFTISAILGAVEAGFLLATTRRAQGSRAVAVARTTRAERSTCWWRCSPCSRAWWTTSGCT